MAIIISNAGGGAVKVEKSSFENEDYLQKFIYKNPDSVPLYDIKEDIRLLILAREFPAGTGAIDALGVDREGDLYVIETKLYKNPDKRAVVAQVLDYGANLWKHGRDFDDFMARIEEKLSQTQHMSLNEKLKQFYGLAEDDSDVFRENMRRNLADGRFKFVVLMDKLHEELKDLLVFLNQNTKFSLFAVEVEYYKHEGFEIVIPKLFGAETTKSAGVADPAAARRKWNEKDFFADAKQKVTDSQFAAIESFYRFSKELTKNGAGEVNWGTGARNGSFVVSFVNLSQKSLYTISSNGYLTLNFGWLGDGSIVQRLKSELEKIEGFEFPDDYASHWFNFSPETWCPVVEKLKAAIQHSLN